MTEPRDILNALNSGKIETAKDNTGSILYQKIGDAMNQKKIEIASTLGSIEDSTTDETTSPEEE